MGSPEELLIWPSDFPPTDPWKKMFYGIPWLGPDTSFFKRLSDLQAARTEAVMQAWPEARQRETALRLGECASNSLGWKTPYFLPGDSAVAVSYGPKFFIMEDFLWEEATRDFEDRMGKRLGGAFWNSVIDWEDKNVTFGELINRVAQKFDSMRR